MLAKFNAVNGEVLAQLMLSGTKLLPLSKEILQASYEEAFAMYEEMASEDQNFRNIYLQWQEFRHQIYAWNKTSESVFANFALNNLNLA